MEWPKVKNIIILILLLLNGFLLSLILGRQQSVSRYEQSAVTGAVKVLEQNGIEVAADALGETSAPVPLTSARDLAAEEKLARALLGDQAQAIDQSGGLYAYATDRGTALFRANGDFSFQLSGAYPDGQDPAGHSEALLAEMGLTGERLTLQETEEGVQVVYYQTLEGVPVWSGRLAFRYGEGGLLELSGTIVAGAALAAGDGEEALDLPNALIRFMSGVMERGDLCSSVSSFRPGYRLVQSFGGDVRLTPVWLVTTNAGRYYLDGISGELEPSDI